MKQNVEREVDDWGQVALVVLQKAQARAAKVIESSKLSIKDCSIRKPFKRLGNRRKVKKSWCSLPPGEIAS